MWTGRTRGSTASRDHSSGVSSNGKTPASKTGYVGSIPATPAMLHILRNYPELGASNDLIVSTGSYRPTGPRPTHRSSRGQLQARRRNTREAFKNWTHVRRSLAAQPAAHGASLRICRRVVQPDKAPIWSSASFATTLEMPTRLQAARWGARACYFFFLALVFLATFLVAAAFFAFFAFLAMSSSRYR